MVATNIFGENAFMWAAATGHLDVLQYLWEVVYSHAFDNDHVRMSEELSRRNHSFGDSVRGGRTAFESASARKLTNVVEYLSKLHHDLESLNN